MSASEIVAAFEESASVVVGLLSSDGRVVALSRELGGVPPAHVVGRPLVELLDPRHAEPVAAAIARARDERSPSSIEVAASARAGGLEWLQLVLGPIAEPGQAHVSSISLVAVDVTARKESEDRLKRAEALLVDAQGTAHLGTWEWDPREPHATWSDELYRIYGVTRDEYVPSYEAYLERVHPDDRAHVMAATERVFREQRPYSHDERILRPDGSIRHLHTWAHAIVDEKGELVRLTGVCQDITDRKVAEIALAERAADHARANELLRHEMQERDRVEKLLRRAQTLEALGRLTGGIAHDFNNVLGVLIGYTSVMLARAAPGSTDREHLTEMMDASERAARMIRQLLAFSSDRVTERGAVPLDAAIGDLADLLRRLAGERIELVLELGGASEHGAPAWVDVGRTQLEQILINLVVNARDAMPQGGRLIVATSIDPIDRDEAASLSVAPGEYASLIVTDTGIGMDAVVLAQVFEPFFTTKDAEHGTGLGLSSVDAIVRRSGGAIVVWSQPGEGTRMTVRLPRVAPRADGGGRPEHEPIARGHETVLLVEDQASLRSVMREALQSYGYRVLDTGDPLEALRMATRDDAPIHALVTDVVMPRVGGRELAERVAAARPGIRVLFVTGHATDVILREGVFDGGIALLHKPFTPAALAARLRVVLDAPSP